VIKHNRKEDYECTVSVLPDCPSTSLKKIVEGNTDMEEHIDRQVCCIAKSGINSGASLITDQPINCQTPRIDIMRAEKREVWRYQFHIFSVVK
jgi:hypothetical protein